MRTIGNWSVNQHSSALSRENLGSKKITPENKISQFRSSTLNTVWIYEENEESCHSNVLSPRFFSKGKH